MRPFEDVRVLDLTHVLAGPFATFQLAVLGADVIKIESPDRPDLTRGEGVIPELNDALYGTYFAGQNGGKRGLTLDLKSPEGADILRRLIETADVLVQNYSGDSLADLGFGVEAAHKINPRLIYCTLTGFGRSGPKGNHPAYDIVVQAFSGMMVANGEAESPAVRVGPPVVDYGTGVQAALAISAALYQRDRTGKGQVIDVSMLDSAFMLMGAHVIETLVTGKAPAAHGNAHPLYAGYATYQTADGEIMIGAYTTEQMAAMMEVLDAPDHAAALRLTPRKQVGARRKADSALIAERLLARSAQEWEDLFNTHHVPAARVRSIEEAVSEAQIASRPVLQEHPDPGDQVGPDRLLVAGFQYDHGSPAVDRAPPRLGEHSEGILAEIGLSSAEIDTLRQKRVI